MILNKRAPSKQNKNINLSSAKSLKTKKGCYLIIIKYLVDMLDLKGEIKLFIGIIN